MNCPFCDSAETEVYNSRPTRENTQVWRRRRCLTCKKTYSTYEHIDLSYMNIIKSQGQHSKYSRAELFNSIVSVKIDSKPSLEQIDELVNTIEAKLIKLGQANVYISQLNQTIADTLAKYDFSLYIAYLSQHTRFHTRTDFKEILRSK